MSENALARWHGQYVGTVFQFFQLIPIARLRFILLPHANGMSLKR